MFVGGREEWINLARFHLCHSIVLASRSPVSALLPSFSCFSSAPLVIILWLSSLGNPFWLLAMMAEVARPTSSSTQQTFRTYPPPRPVEQKPADEQKVERVVEQTAPTPVTNISQPHSAQPYSAHFEFDSVEQVQHPPQTTSTSNGVQAPAYSWEAPAPKQEEEWQEVGGMDLAFPPEGQRTLSNNDEFGPVGHASALPASDG